MTRAEAIRAAALAIADNVTDDPDRREALASELTALAFRWTRSADPSEIRPGFHTFGPVLPEPRVAEELIRRQTAAQLGPWQPAREGDSPVVELAEVDSMGSVAAARQVIAAAERAEARSVGCIDGHGEQHAAHDFPDDPNPMYGPGHCSRCYADAPVTVATATPRQHEWLAVPKWNDKNFQLCNGCGIYRCNGGCGDPSVGAVPDADCPTHGDSVAQTCNGYPVGTLPPVGTTWDAQAHVTATATAPLRSPCTECNQVGPHRNGCPRRTLRTALPGSVHAAADALAATPLQHTWVTATDGDIGATLDYEHCGVCGVRRCTWLAGDATTACDHDPDCPTHGDEIARRCPGVAMIPEPTGCTGPCCGGNGPVNWDH